MSCIRKAEPEDLPEVVRLAAELCRSIRWKSWKRSWSPTQTAGTRLFSWLIRRAESPVVLLSADFGGITWREPKPRRWDTWRGSMSVRCAGDRESPAFWWKPAAVGYSGGLQGICQRL